MLIGSAFAGIGALGFYLMKRGSGQNEGGYHMSLYKSTIKGS